jgi:hypothetical protein
LFKISFLKILYKEMQHDFCTVKYIAQETGMSRNYIWNVFRLMKAMRVVEYKQNPKKANSILYKLREDYTDFYKFLEEIELRFSP